MQDYKKIDCESLKQKYLLSVQMKRIVNLFRLIVRFIMLNIEILEHIFLKIDKHTIAFENKYFREDF